MHVDELEKYFREIFFRKYLSKIIFETFSNFSKIIFRKLFFENYFSKNKFRKVSANTLDPGSAKTQPRAYAAPILILVADLGGVLPRALGLRGATPLSQNGYGRTTHLPRCRTHGITGSIQIDHEMTGSHRFPRTSDPCDTMPNRRKIFAHGGDIFAKGRKIFAHGGDISPCTRMDHWARGGA